MLSVNEQVEIALALEQREHIFEKALASKAAKINRLVELGDNPAAQLTELVTLYIAAVPELLAELEQAAQTRQLTNSTQILLDIILDFFSLRSEDLAERSGIASVMVKSYLAYRLFEEVNDACLYHTGRAIAQLDMTLTNTIIHTLIGEPFANNLDTIVNSALEKLFERVKDDTLFMQELSHSNLVKICQKWPSLSGQVGLHSALPVQLTEPQLNYRLK